MEPVTSQLRLIVMCAVALCCGSAVAYQVEHINYRTFTGYLEAEVIAVHAPYDGIVEAILKHESEAVQPGVVIANISTAGIDQAITNKRHEIALLKSELAKVEALARLELNTREREFNKELFETQMKTSAYLREKYTAELQTIAWEDYLKSHNAIAMSTLTPDVFRNALEGKMRTDEQSINAILAHGTALNSLEVYSAQVELCQNREKSLQDSMKKLPSEINLAFGIELMKAKIEQSNQELTELEKIANERDIKSTVHGRVGTLQIHYGSRVQKGERVGEIIDEQCRFLLTPIPTSEIPYLHEGEIVGLFFPGNKKSQGVIRKIPMRVMTQGENTSYVMNPDPFVEVRIDPTNDSVWPSVPIGAAIEVELTSKK